MPNVSESSMRCMGYAKDDDGASEFCYCHSGLLLVRRIWCSSLRNSTNVPIGSALNQFRRIIVLNIYNILRIDFQHAIRTNIYAIQSKESERMGRDKEEWNWNFIKAFIHGGMNE